MGSPNRSTSRSIFPFGASLASVSLARRARVASRVGALLLAISVVTGCPGGKKKIDLGALLKDAPDGAYVAGTAVGLGDPEILNQNDFIYAVAFSARGDALAWVHHVTNNMEMSVTNVDKVVPRVASEPRFRVPINHHEFDIEDLVFTAGGNGEGPSLILPSRQGIVRQYDSSTGALQREFIYGEPLVRAAINPSRTLVALGSNLGRVILLDATTLAFRGEAILHKDEVHGLAFKDDRTLLTGAFDRKLFEISITAGGDEEFAVASTPLKSGDQLFISHLGGARAISTVRDARQQWNLISSKAVKRLKLRPAKVGRVTVMTTVGEREVPAVDLGDLRIRHLSLGSMIAAVCDFCLPVGAELALGKDALMRVQLADDVANEQVIVRIGRTPSALPKTTTTAPPATAPPTTAPPATAPPPVATATDPAAASTTTAAAPTTTTPAEVGMGTNSAADATKEPAKKVAAKEDGLPPLAVIATGTVKMEITRTLETVGPVTDISIDAKRKTALVTYSHAIALRTYDIYDAEKNNELPPPSSASAGVLLNLDTFAFGKRFVGHEGFTVAGAISPDGRTIATGGWDRRVLLFDVATGDLITEREEGWLIRQLRFSPDGQTLAVATWTPALGTVGTLSDPSLLLYPIQYQQAAAENETQTP